MLTTILVVLLAWAVVGGAVAIVDADDGRKRRGPDWLWLIAYGPALWGLVVYVVVTESVKHLVKLAERKLRG